MTLSKFLLKIKMNLWKMPKIWNSKFYNLSNNQTIKRKREVIFLI